MESNFVGKNAAQEFHDKMETLLSIKDIISNINKENIDQSAKSIINKFDNTYPIFFNTFITQIIYIIIITRMNEFDIYIVFLKEIEILEKDIKKFNEANILNIFTRFLMNKCTQESYYLLEKLVVNNLLPPTSVRNTLNLYFAHYMSKQEIKKSGYNEFKRRFEKNYEELSKNDWELHKQYVKEGVNPNEIAKIIRNDEIEKLQEMSSQNNFNFDRIIKPSLYERCDFINKENVSLIDYAAFFGSVKCFKYLLMNGANVENTGKYAIAGGNIEIIHLCEQNHSSFEKPYKTAIKFHRNDIFHYLYENKIEEIDSLENLGKKCILYHNYEIFMFLLEEGMEIDDEIINASATIENIYLTKYFLETHQIPENILAYSGNVEYVKYILEQEGIDINGKDDNGLTALMYASCNDDIEVVQLLLKQEGIDINAQNNDGGTALTDASSIGNIQIVKLLLEQEGIDINAKDNYEWTALIWASEGGFIEIVELLLKQKGIDINAKDDLGKTALMWASSKKHTDIVKLLLEQKEIDINAKNDLGYTALMYASQHGFIEIVKLLLEQVGIDINAKDNIYFNNFIFQNNIWKLFQLFNTALMLASEKGHTEIVKLLLEQEGIDINAKDNYGDTALIEASTHDYTEMVKFLQDYK